MDKTVLKEHYLLLEEKNGIEQRRKGEDGTRPLL
jgi:hypothetical protein